MKSGKLILASMVIAGACALIASAESVRERLFESNVHNQRTQQKSNVSITAKKHRLMNLKYRTARHNTPDAIVYVPPGFDPDGPLNVVLYNHGLTNDLDEAFDIWHLDRAMQNAPRNTVMILPEWAQRPQAFSSASGDFDKENFFRKMLGEIMSKTPELSNKTVDDIRTITIATFSGGFRASQTQIHRNGLEDKVRGLVLLDSLYESDFFDAWLRKNIRELAAGHKFYQNFYFDTAGNSMAQLARVKRMVADAGLPLTAIYHEKSKPKEVIPASVISAHGIVYVYTTMYSDTHSAHQTAAFIYFPQSLKAIALKDNLDQIARSEQGVDPI